MITGDLVASVVVTGRADLNDAQRVVLEPLLPKGKRPRRPAEVDQAAADRWDPLAGAGWRAVARRSTSLWLVAGGVWVVLSLAAGWGLGADSVAVAGSC
jgi:hypothetical protein